MSKSENPALEALSEQIRNDPDYAWSWHCALACAYQDEGIDHPAANRAAARFMKQAFGAEGYEPEREAA